MESNPSRLKGCIMKKCSKCKHTKENAAFSWRNKAKGTLISWCKDCMRVYDKARGHGGKGSKRYEQSRKRIERNAQYTWDYLLSHPCVDCGEADPIVLEFDHIEQDNKLSTVCDLTRNGCSIEKIQTEISKCDVRCANCHRRRTAVQMDWYKSIK